MTTSLSPLTRLSKPFGALVSLKSSVINNEPIGSFSEGFNIKELPVARANGNIHIGTIAGKLNGVIPKIIPNGENSLQESISVLIFLLYSPFITSPIPHAYSTFSMPLLTSPKASS